MAKASSLQIASDARARLIERIVQSRYIARSARLRDLLEYLCDRVVTEGALEIHEQEVGHAVFGRAKDYDTALDNIVRVHASTLRKRLEQYFAEDGRDESLIVELPRGNYAPLFRARPQPPVVAAGPVISELDELPVADPPAVTAPRPRVNRWLAAAAVVFAAATLVLAIQRTATRSDQPAVLPDSVRSFWSALFLPRHKTDIVLDDAALALFQELDGRPVSLNEYFDRSYQRRLVNKPDLTAVALKRQSSYASASLLYQFSRTAAALSADWAPRFARDYTFRELKGDSVILLGNIRSNPWIEPFQSRVGIHWEYDVSSATYYPTDDHAYKPSGDHPDGFCSVALLPNLGGTGDVAVLSCTGGAATTSASNFLVDEDCMSKLRAKLGATGARFPYFEALLRIPSRSRLPKDVEIVIARPAK